ncbi:MAG: hypothetical protein KBF74_04545 [Ferruginibacter sp.]|nr:hypothetical protein [Ferruginibacter sp.]
MTDIILIANGYHLQQLNETIALTGRSGSLNIKSNKMASTIATYYSDELIDWNESILFYNKETDDLSQKLGDVLRRNSIVGIAEKVESQQELLNLASDKFYRLQIDIQQQQEFLKTDSTFIDDSFISEETEKKQTELRKQMQLMEKEYIDVKFNCYDFLSGTLKK